MATHKWLLLVLLLSTSCRKECETSTNPVCSEKPPVNEACTAYFERWFYDKGTNSCNKVAYSGCSQKGFATRTECEACKCK